MGRSFLIATSNPGKFQEIGEIFSDTSFKLLSLSDLKISNILEETGLTHEENALLKARHFFNLSKIPTIGEDSGIEVEALKGEMGIYTRRWGAGEKASDEEWIAFFMKRMEEFQEETERKAKFVCSAAFFDGKNEGVFTGECTGTITKTLSAPIQKGIPLSSCFRPDGFDNVYSALITVEKNRISHRGKALNKLKEWMIALSFNSSLCF